MNTSAERHPPPNLIRMFFISERNFHVLLLVLTGSPCRFSRFTFQSQVSAVWFSSQKNEARLKCPGGLTTARLVYYHVLQYRAPVSWLCTGNDLPRNRLSTEAN